MMELNNVNGIVIKRGDVLYVDLGTPGGSEQGGVRPVIVVQNNIGNKYSPTFIGVSLTSQVTKATLPTHVEFKKGQFGLTEDSLFLGEQVRTLDKRRIKDKVGEIDAEHNKLIKEALEISMVLGETESKFMSRAEKDLNFRAGYIKELEITMNNVQKLGDEKTIRPLIDSILKQRENALKILELLCKQNKVSLDAIYHPFQPSLAV